MYKWLLGGYTIKIKIVSTIILGCVLGAVGCAQKSENDKDVNTVLSVSENETGLFDILSEEQRDYLVTQMGYTKEGINVMTYESINYKLLGTGLEIYNTSSGFEVNGVDYTYDEDVNTSEYGKYYSNIVKNNGKFISLEEVYRLRDKDINLRLDDFLSYDFICEEIGNGIYQYKLCIEDIENLYYLIEFTEDELGNVHIDAPYICYNEFGEKTYTFSAMYDRDDLEIFIYDEPQFSYEGKLITDIVYSSVTYKSLVIQVKNYSDDDYILNETYSIYRKEGGEYVKLDEFSYVAESEETLKSKTGSNVPIRFGNDEEKLEIGEYRINFGINEGGYVYKEMEFTIEN